MSYMILGCILMFAVFGVGFIFGALYGFGLRGREIDRVIEIHNNEWR